MAAILVLELTTDEIRLTIDTNVPLILFPKITPPVYFPGSLAAMPYMVFWYIPLDTEKKKNVYQTEFYI